MPRVLRIVLAVLAGYAIGAIVVAAGTPVVSMLFSARVGPMSTALLLAAQVAVKFFSAVCAGYVCARVAPEGAITISLGVLVLGLLAIAVIGVRFAIGAPEPPGYVPLVTLLRVVGLWAGAMTERAVHGPRRSSRLIS